jgi:hypothetical protein
VPAADGVGEAVEQFPGLRRVIDGLRHSGTPFGGGTAG